MRQVERGQLWVMRVHALVASLILLVPGTVADLLLRERFGLPGGAVLLPLLAILALMVLAAPVRRYRALRYRIDDQDLHVARGIWVRTETIVPLARVQHIDVSQGPVERAFSVSRLVLHTAGTLNSLVVLPGLAREDAEAMRDRIRARIGPGGDDTAAP